MIQTRNVKIKPDFLLTTLLLAIPAHAETDSLNTSSSNWSFVIAPYAWLAGTGGTVTTNGVEQDFDLSFEDILDITTGGFQIYTRARHKRFFIAFCGNRQGRGCFLALGGTV